MFSFVPWERLNKGEFHPLFVAPQARAKNYLFWWNLLGNCKNSVELFTCDDEWRHRREKFLIMSNKIQPHKRRKKLIFRPFGGRYLPLLARRSYASPSWPVSLHRDTGTITKVPKPKFQSFLAFPLCAKSWNFIFLLKVWTLRIFIS